MTALPKDPDNHISNVLTVDLEEWFHVCGVSSVASFSGEWRVRDNVARLLEALDRFGVSATFFVLGSVAEALPRMVADIAAAGHEIASHGYSHRMVTGLTPSEFRDELKRTADILVRHSGGSPRGFRAPQWSLSPDKTPWAFDILLEEGYVYDSSCSPLPFVGDPRGSRLPYRMELTGGALWEIPPMVSRSIIGNLPTGGGWGFRFFPLGMIERTIRELNDNGHPAVLFLHPREIDPHGPRLPLSRLRSFVAYGPRTDALERLETVLRSFRFITLSEMTAQWESA